MTQETRLSELLEVCAAGDSDLLEEKLATGRLDVINYKDPDWNERAPLHWCCIKGKSDMTRCLLEKGAHPGVRSSTGWTPAHFAAEGGRTHVLRTLHNFKAPMNRKDLYGDTPKRIAEIYGHKESTEFLVLAEAEYRERRRKAELCGDAEPYDDEDLDWCYRNNVTPEIFVSEDELAEINSTTTSVSGSLQSLQKSRHYPKASSRRGTPTSGRHSRSSTPLGGRRKSRRVSKTAKK
uniref:Ankyrin repeat domain-containing protein 66-like n=1 Tax=Phallusia mammillata TaxID=59560 RepID=A0A6F9D6Z5_9ASCI|nr:ankyrin repeat domain-containing protein 66-like [Phallusia mammillata]